MASKTYTQYRSTSGHSSAPESSLSNYISNYHDYFSIRTGQNESVMIIGDYENGSYEDATVYTYNSDTRNISVTQFEKVTCTVYENFYARGNISGIPSVPSYQIESNIVNSFILFVGVGIFAVSSLLKHFWKIVRRSS